ncbi:putative reverse transcriptase domain-containing protein [Tanacetum coccineum]|uniref:Reverse transcriptase domain-containing protein n=1 Tax=Tanacetum coccineum TaxID=301880 RepID=A0ABQ5HZ14_9ASTR
MVNNSSIPKDLNKIKVVKDWKVPKTLSEIRTFLGLEGYYRHFIVNFSKIAKPHTALTQKNQKYEWGAEQEETFQTLKDNLCNAPIRGKAIAYVSRQLRIHEKNYTTQEEAFQTQKNQKYEWGAEQEEAFQTLKDNLCNAPIRSFPDGPDNFVVYYDVSIQGFRCDLELGVVVFALKTWRHDLYETRSIIYTYHKSLQHIFDQKELNMSQWRWIELFSDYDCEIR